MKSQDRKYRNYITGGYISGDLNGNLQPQKGSIEPIKSQDKMPKQDNEWLKNYIGSFIELAFSVSVDEFSDGTLERWDSMKQEIIAYISNNYIKKEDVEYIIGIAPPCEENCSDVRHAYHKGGYDLVIAQEQRLQQLNKQRTEL